MRALRRTALAVAVTAAVTLIAGCSTATAPATTPTSASASPAEAKPVSGGTLTFDHDVEPFSLDPHANADMSNQIVAANIFDNLVQHGSDGRFHPWLASSWDISPDGLVYTFHLRDDVTFHNGERFDAEAVKANFDRGNDGATNGTPFGAIVQRGGSYRVVDEFTFEITLAAPYAPTLDDLSFPATAIIAPAALAADQLPHLADGTGLIGTGPFKVESYTKGTEIVLVRNEDYAWGPGGANHQGPAYLDALTIRFVPEAGNRVGALTSGQTDAIIQVPTSSLADIEKRDDLQVQIQDASGFPYSLELNSLHGPFADKAVREAFRAGIDVDGLLQAVYSGYAKRAWAIVTEPTAPIGSSAESELAGSWSYDPAAAAALLDGAGWTDVDADGYRVKDGERLSVSWLVRAPNIRDQRDVLAQGIQSEAKKLGIEVVLNPVDNATYFATLKENAYDLSDTSLTRADAYIVWATLAKNFVAANGGYNWANVTDDTVDGLLQSQFTALDDASRVDAFQEVQRIVSDEAWILPLNVLQYRVASADRVHDITFQLAGFPLLYDVWLDGASK